MFPNRWMTRAVVPLALIVLAAGCVPSAPAEAPLPATPSPTHEIVVGELKILSPEEALRADAESYARQYGVSVEEAVRRMQYQDGIGDLNAALTANEAATFGGLWIEHEPEYRVVVLFTRGGKSRLQPYLKDQPFANLVEVHKARYSLAALESIYAQTTRELEKLDFEVNIMLDVQSNRVKVIISDREWFEGELKKAGAQLPKGTELSVIEGGSTARDMDLLLTPPVPGIAFPRQKPVEGMQMCMAALMIGTLRQEGECLYVEPLYGGGKIVPIWPSSYSLRVENGHPQVIDEMGQVAVRVGEEVWMGGGSAGVDPWVLQQIPPACQGDYFIACSGVRPNLRQGAELFNLDILTEGDQTALFLRYKPALDGQIEGRGAITGRLSAEKYGRCLHLQGGDVDSPTLLWPPGWSAKFEDRTVVVRDAAGQEVTRLGDEVHLRGRPVPASGDVPVFMELIHELPGDCSTASWLVDGVE